MPYCCILLFLSWKLQFVKYMVSQSKTFLSNILSSNVQSISLISHRTKWQIFCCWLLKSIIWNLVYSIFIKNLLVWSSESSTQFEIIDLANTLVPNMCYFLNHKWLSSLMHQNTQGLIAFSCLEIFTILILDSIIILVLYLISYMVTKLTP